jgi:hypothetical protein
VGEKNYHRLTLNCVPIEIDSNTVIPIGIQSYQDGKLEKLWLDYYKTHFFKRDGNQILSISISEDSLPIGDETQEVNLTEKPRLLAALALDSIKRYFLKRESTIISYKPLKISSKLPEDNLLEASTPDHLRLPHWLETREYFIFDTRVLYSAQDIPLVLLFFDIRVRNIISASCQEIFKEGVFIENRYVQRLEVSDKPLLPPKRYLVGRVRQIQGDLLVLDDHADGYETIPITEAYLEQRKENLSWCILQLFPDLASSILENLERNLVFLRSGKEKLCYIANMFEHLREQKVNITPNIELKIGRILRNEGNSISFPKYEIVRKPILIFDPSRRSERTDIWNERGLDKNGPYDQLSFTPTKPKIAIICQASKEGQVDQFIYKFLEGLPNIFIGTGKDKRAPYAKGFIRRFAIEKPEVKFFVTQNSQASSYLRACKEAVSYSSNRNDKWDLAIIQIEDYFHHLHGDDNPYLVTKSFFLKHQVPVQEIEIESMTLNDNQLIYTLNNISLASYAKMGGTPWRLQANPPHSHELVIGLGSCYMGKSRVGSKERVVGITTVFTGDGNYLLNNSSAAVSFENYSEALIHSLRETVTTVREDQNWTKNDSIHLVFHTFKPLKDSEIIAVKSVMEELGDYDTKYAFIHFVDDHPFYVFDENNTKGVLSTHQKPKGQLAPPRGLLWKIDKHEALLSLTGARELKRSEDGIPQPLLLRLDRDSTFKDITYLCRQAFAFSCHSWRSFSPAPLPITILYSELIARLLRGLSDVSGWDADAMLGRIGRTRWFL